MTGGKLFRLMVEDTYVCNFLREKQCNAVDDKCVLSTQQISETLSLISKYREIISKTDFKQGTIPSDENLTGR